MGSDWDKRPILVDAWGGGWGTPDMAAGSHSVPKTTPLMIGIDTAAEGSTVIGDGVRVYNNVEAVIEQIRDLTPGERWSVFEAVRRMVAGD